MTSKEKENVESKVQWWAVKDIHPDPKQPRKIHSDVDLRLLADNLKRAGQIHPIEVTPDGQIVVGERRWLAHKLVGLENIKVIVVEPKDIKDVRLRQVSENIHRTEMNPIDLAKQMLLKKQETGWADRKLGEYYGVAHSTVTAHIRLLGLPSVLVKAVADGSITWAKAATLVSLKDEAHIKWVVKEYQAGHLKSNEAVRHCAHYLSRGGDWDKLKELVKTSPSESALAKLVAESGLEGKIRKNLSAGNRLINIAEELALAVRARDLEKVAPLQYGRLCATLAVLHEELEKFMEKSKSKEKVK